MAANLKFGQPRHSGGPVHLVFGGSTGPVAPDPVSVDITLALDDVQVTALALYDNKLPRRVSTSAALPHQVATPTRIERAAVHAQAARGELLAGEAWQVARAAAAQPRATWAVTSKAGREAAAAWEPAAQISRSWALTHQRATGVQQQAGMGWAPAEPISRSWALTHQRADQLHRAALAAWQLAKAHHTDHAALWGDGRPVSGLLLAPWQLARPVPAGREVWPPVDSGARPPREISTHLVFACPPWAGGPVHLVFGHVCTSAPGPLAPFYILPARFYMAVHSLVAHRLPDLTEIPIYDLILSADAGSFGWTFSASAPVSAFDALAPTSGLPAQVRFTLDGLQFVFVVDSLQRSDEFGRRSVRFAGRSATALLARPYARETTRNNASAAATAQQLAEQALDLSGVALDWGLTDWLVGAGAWSHSGTPLAAVQAIVEAAGGYLQSHRSAATLLARHPYPELAGGLPGGPWNWYQPGVVPDVELAHDAIITSAIERRDGPAINGVYVSGTTQGVSALVRRDGTQGEALSSPITDALITAQEVAMQRGLSVLGAAGPKHLVTLNLPVLTGPSQPGVLDVGQLVQVNASSPWRGRVRSISVDARMPSVRQTAQIERHLEVA